MLILCTTVVHSHAAHPRKDSYKKANNDLSPVAQVQESSGSQSLIPVQSLFTSTTLPPWKLHVFNSFGVHACKRIESAFALICELHTARREDQEALLLR